MSKNKNETLNEIVENILKHGLSSFGKTNGFSARPSGGLEVAGCLTSFQVAGRTRFLIAGTDYTHEIGSIFGYPKRGDWQDGILFKGMGGHRAVFRMLLDKICSSEQSNQLLNEMNVAWSLASSERGYLELVKLLNDNSKAMSKTSVMVNGVPFWSVVASRTALLEEMIEKSSRYFPKNIIDLIVENVPTSDESEANIVINKLAELDFKVSENAVNIVKTRKPMNDLSINLVSLYEKQTFNKTTKKGNQPNRKRI